MRNHHFIAVAAVPLWVLLAWVASPGVAAEPPAVDLLWLGKDLWQFGGGKYVGQDDDWKSMPGSTLTLRYDKGPLPKPVELVIPLKDKLPLGRYRLFVKNFYIGKMEATLGDITLPMKIVRFDWSPAVTFETNAEVDKITLRYFPTTFVEGLGKPQEQHYIVQGVFLTTDPTKVPVREGKIVSVLEAGPPPAVKGSVVENGSFELGLMPWGKQFGSKSFFTCGDLDATTAAHGRQSLRIGAKDGFGLESRFYRLPVGTYWLSFHAKASKPTKVTARLMGIAEDLKGYRQCGMEKEFEVGTEWKPLSFSGKIVERPGYLYCIVFEGKPSETQTIWLDAVQLSPQEPREYRQAHAVEVGWSSTTAGNIFYEGQPASITIRAAGPANGKAKIELATMGLPATSSATSQPASAPVTTVIDLDASGLGSIKLDLDTRRRGLFRLDITSGQSRSQMVYSCLPPNEHLNEVYEAGSLGADVLFNPRHLEILKRANFNWAITKFVGRWYMVEPQQGKFQFDDAAVAAARTHKMAVLIQLLNPDWGAQDWLKPLLPVAHGLKWEADKQEAFMAAWTRFAGETAGHFRDSVHYWEIENEPNAQFTPQQYGRMLKLAASAIRKADPKAKIVGFSGGGYSEKFFAGALDAAGGDSFDVASVHFYGSDLADHRAFAAFLKQAGKDGWNTETGPSCPSFYSHLPQLESLRSPDYWDVQRQQCMDNAVTQVRNYLTTRSIGGMKKYFHYFARFTNNSPSQPTRWFGNCKEITEFDGSLRANGVVLSIASHLLDEAEYHGPVEAAPGLTLQVFSKAGKTVAFAWHDGGKPLKFDPPASAKLSAFDLFGNPLPLPADIGRSPVYFRSDLPAVGLVKTVTARPDAKQPVPTGRCDCEPS